MKNEEEESNNKNNINKIMKKNEKLKILLIIKTNEILLNNKYNEKWNIKMKIINK